MQTGLIYYIIRLTGHNYSFYIASQILNPLPCASSPCDNGGVCINSENNKTYTCHCPGGFTYRRCAGITFWYANFIWHIFENKDFSHKHTELFQNWITLLRSWFISPTDIMIYITNWDHDLWGSAWGGEPISPLPKIKSASLPSP